MKKAYLVVYSSPKGEKMSWVKRQLILIGTVKVLADSGRMLVAVVQPAEEVHTAKKIKESLASVISIFEDKLLVAPLEGNETSEINIPEIHDLIMSSDGKELGGKRNFDRFETRAEAMRFYNMEKPSWVFPDGVGASTSVTFGEWLWLPVRDNGIYVRGKDETNL